MSLESIADDSNWIVWTNHSGNRTVTAHICELATLRTLCGRSPGYLTAKAAITTPRCEKCVIAKKQFAQLQSVDESAEK